MTEQEWLDRRAKELTPCEIAEKKRQLREDFIANAKYYWITGKSKWISNDYHLIPNIGLSIGIGANYKARLYEMYGLEEVTIRVLICFLKFKQEWSFTYSKQHPETMRIIRKYGML